MARCSNWCISICCLSLAGSGGLLSILVSRVYERCNGVYLGLILVNAGLLGLYEVENLRRFFTALNDRERWCFWLSVIVGILMILGFVLCFIEAIPLWIWQVLLFASGGIYILVPFGYYLLLLHMKLPGYRKLMLAILLPCLSVLVFIPFVRANQLVRAAWIFYTASSICSVRFRILQILDTKKIFGMMEGATSFIGQKGSAHLSNKDSEVAPTFGIYASTSQHGADNRVRSSGQDSSTALVTSPSKTLPQTLLPVSFLPDFNSGLPGHTMEKWERSIPSKAHDPDIKTGAALALKDLLRHASVAGLHDIVNQLSLEERRLLWCVRQKFSEPASLYTFAIEKTGTVKEDLRAIGTLYNPGLTVEELVKLWNSLIENIGRKTKFFANDAGGLWRSYSAKPLSHLCVSEHINEGATIAVQTLVNCLTLCREEDLSFMTSDILAKLGPEQRSLLCFMGWRFQKPQVLYGACFGREFDSSEWSNVRQCYADYTQKETSFYGIFMMLDGILSSIYWSRMLK